MNEQTKDMSDFDDGQVRQWTRGSEVGLAFIVELREARAEAIKTLIVEATEGKPTAATAGAIGLIDRLFYVLREMP